MNPKTLVGEGILPALAIPAPTGDYPDSLFLTYTTARL